jgi:hypothetical protein
MLTVRLVRLLDLDLLLVLLKACVPEFPRTNPHVAIDLLKTSPCRTGAGVMTLADTARACVGRFRMLLAVTSDTNPKTQ